MADDIELFGLELTREYQYCQEELNIKKTQLAELSKKELNYKKDIDDIMWKLKQAESKVEEIRAQLIIRTEAMQRLELENSTMRDSVAKLSVQVETNSLEKDRILQKWRLAEGERISWEKKCENLQETVMENMKSKEQCILLQNQIKNTATQIVSQQEINKKEFGKVERAAEDAVKFAKTVSNHLMQQEAQTKDVAKLVEKTETKYLALAVELTKARRERDEIFCEKEKESEKYDTRYYEEWKNYQEKMKARINGFIAENQRLIEELNLANQTICPKCGEKPYKEEQEN